MSSKPKYSTDLRKLDYSPDNNPLMEPNTVAMRRVRVRSGLAERTLVDLESGEVTASAVIHSLEDKDDTEFVKVFSAGIAAAYELTRTGQRVFQAVLQEYERTPMSGGFADCVYLAWFDGGLSGRDIGMSAYTFNRGFRELIDKQFLAPRAPNTYWVNPALFFKGNRVLFVKEYKRKHRAGDVAIPDNQKRSIGRE